MFVAGIIEQLLTRVNWDYLDFLIVDTPPGTSDEHLSIAELLKESGKVMFQEFTFAVWYNPI